MHTYTFCAYSHTCSAVGKLHLQGVYSNTCWKHTEKQTRTCVLDTRASDVCVTINLHTRNTENLFKMYFSCQEVRFSFVSVHWFAGRIIKKNYWINFHKTWLQNSLTFVADLDEGTAPGSSVTGQIPTLRVVGQPDIPTPCVKLSNQLSITNSTFKSGTIYFWRRNSNS